MQDNNGLANVASMLRRRSVTALLAAWAEILVIMLVTMAAIYFAGTASDRSITGWYEGAYNDDTGRYTTGSIFDIGEPDTSDVKNIPVKTRMEIEKLRSQRIQVEKETEKLASERAEIEEKNRRMQDELDVKMAEATYRKEETQTRATTLGATVTRFLTVALAFYLSQILIGFARYHFRLSHHLAMSANALLLAGTDTEKLAQWTEMLSGNIEFGKSPEMPIDKVLDAISDAIKKEAKT